MATTQELFDFVKTQFNVSLQENDLWSSVAQHFSGSYMDYDELRRFLEYIYPAIVRIEPRLRDLTDDLFRGIIFYALCNEKMAHLMSSTAAELFRIWTVDGTRDISRASADYLRTPLRTLILRPGEYGTALDIIFLSPMLWNNLEKNVLKHYDESPSYQRVIHRHAPHLKDYYNNGPSEISWYYASMCGLDPLTKAGFLEMRSIFTGPHNNPLAWHTALAVCDLKDPSIAGNWMKMSETFLSLRLEPKDQDAWKFWHSLVTCTASDTSGRALMVALSEKKSPMSQAFNKNWSIVSVLYEGKERYERAANVFITQNDALVLPYTNTTSNDDLLDVC